MLLILFTRIRFAGALAILLSCAPLHSAAGHETKLEIDAARINLLIGAQTWSITRLSEAWVFEGIAVTGKSVVKALSGSDSFFVNGGGASRFEVLTNEPNVKAVRFFLKSNSVCYTVVGDSRLPSMRVRLEGPDTAVCAFRSATADAAEHVAWVTRGYIATDADAHEDFIDASGPQWAKSNRKSPGWSSTAIWADV